MQPFALQMGTEALWAIHAKSRSHSVVRLRSSFSIATDAIVAVSDQKQEGGPPALEQMPLQFKPPAALKRNTNLGTFTKQNLYLSR